LVEFQRAYDLVPNYRVLYNIGRAAALVKDYSRALIAFQRYLAEGKGKLEKPRLQQVTSEVTRLKGFVGEVRIECNIEGAALRVDGRDVGKSPVSVLVNAGHHTFEAIVTGSLPARRYLAIAGGDKKTVRLEIVLQVAKAASVPASRPTKKLATLPPVTEQPPKEKLGVWFWTAAIGTGVLAIATGVTGGFALKASNTFDTELAKVPTTAEAIDDARRRMKRLALATDILIGVSVATAATATYLFFTDRKLVKRERSRRSVQVSAGFGSVVVSGRF
jgi:hypothetical protein